MEFIIFYDHISSHYKILIKYSFIKNNTHLNQKMVGKSEIA